MKQTITSKTVLFITGAFVSHHCWDEWITWFEQKGFRVKVVPWPQKDGPAAVLRHRHPDKDLAALRLEQLTSFYRLAALSLPEKPVIIGHSIGGLIAQLLLQEGLADAAVAIHSVPPQGIFSFSLPFLRSGWGPLGYFTNVNKTFLMSFEQWQYAFTNGLPAEVQKEGFELVIPESKRIVRDTITHAARVDFSRPHRPLLLIGGTNDHTIPPALNYKNHQRYTDKESITCYKIFNGRTHYVLNQEGWQEIAAYILRWLQSPASD